MTQTSGPLPFLLFITFGTENKYWLVIASPFNMPAVLLKVKFYKKILFKMQY